jgi:hypothetical protein
MYFDISLNMRPPRKCTTRRRPETRLALALASTRAAVLSIQCCSLCPRPICLGPRAKAKVLFTIQAHLGVGSNHDVYALLLHTFLLSLSFFCFSFAIQSNRSDLCADLSFSFADCTLCLGHICFPLSFTNSQYTMRYDLFFFTLTALR